MTWPLAFGTVLGLVLCRWIGKLLYPEQFRKELAPWFLSAATVIASAAAGWSLQVGLLAAFVSFATGLAVSMFLDRPSEIAEVITSPGQSTIVFEGGFFVDSRTACHGLVRVDKESIAFVPQANRAPACAVSPLTVTPLSRVLARQGRWSEHRTILGPREVIEFWRDDTVELKIVCRDAKSNARQIERLWAD